MHGLSVYGDRFGEGQVCGCEHGSEHGADLCCPACASERVATLGAGSVEGQDALAGTTQDTAEIQRKLYLLHSATGHGPLRHMLQALRRHGVSEAVMHEAQKFRCSVCEERVKPIPRPLATLEPLPPKWSTIACDLGYWTHPVSQQQVQFLMVVDEGSRFRVGRVLLEGKKSHASAALFLETLRTCWIQYFGLPNVLRVDPDGSFRSTAVAEFCDRNQVYLDIIAGEAHWKLSACEQAIQAAKEIMTKLALEDGEISAEAALAEANRACNNRDWVRGYSPIQHALGRAPDHTGRFFNNNLGPSPDLLVENADGELPRTLARMQVAEKAFLDWTNEERVRRALHSRARPRRDYDPGELVYIWRKQVSGQPGTKSGRFIGPARVLAVERHQSSDGGPGTSGSVWCVRGRRLVKCSVEQLRPATDREIILAELMPDHQPDWSFQRVAEELGGNEYEDVSTEIPAEEEWSRLRILYRSTSLGGERTQSGLSSLQSGFRGFHSQIMEKEVPLAHGQAVPGLQLLLERECHNKRLDDGE